MLHMKGWFVSVFVAQLAHICSYKGAGSSYMRLNMQVAYGKQFAKSNATEPLTMYVILNMNVIVIYLGDICFAY